MRLVDQEQAVGAEQSRVDRTHLTRNAITFEQQPGSDHVDRADNDRRGGGVFQPKPVVGVLTAQGGHRQQRRALQSQVRSDIGGEAGLVRRQPGSDRLGHRRRLVHHRPPIDDINQPPRQSRARRPRQQPERHDRRFAKPGRQVERIDPLPRHEHLIEPPLPAVGRVAGQGFETAIEGIGGQGHLSKPSLVRSRDVRKGSQANVIKLMCNLQCPGRSGISNVLFDTARGRLRLGQL